MTLADVIAKAQSGHCMSNQNTDCVKPRGKDDYLCRGCREEYDADLFGDPEPPIGSELEAECRTPMGAHGRFGDLPPYRGEQ